MARENNNFHQVLREVAKGFKNSGFFLKPDWSHILVSIFTEQMLKEVPATVLPTDDNSAANEQTNVEVEFNNFTENGSNVIDEDWLNVKIDNGGFEENELSVNVLFVEDNQAIQIETNDTQLLVNSTTDVLQNSHDNDVIPESRPTKRNPIQRPPCEGSLDDVDMQKEGNFIFSSDLTGADCTPISAKVKIQSSETSHVKFVNASSSSLNIELSRLIAGAVAAQHDTIIAELVASPSSKPESRSTILPTDGNSAANEPTNVDVAFNNLTENGIDEANGARFNNRIKMEENELKVIVPLNDGDNDQPIQDYGTSNGTQLLVISTSDVLENSHDNAVIPESRPTKRNRMTSFSTEDNSDDEENLLVPLGFRTPSPIKFVSRNANVKIKFEKGTENAVDHRKNCETTRQGKCRFLENLIGVDRTQTCAKINCQSSKKSYVRFISAFDKYKQSQIVTNSQSPIAVEKALVSSSKSRNASKNKNAEQKQKVPDNLIAATKAIEKTLRQIQSISSPKNLLATVPSSSSNIAMSRFTCGTVTAQHDSTIAESVASTSCMHSKCEYYENQPTAISDDMDKDSEELPTTTSHLSKKNQIADLPVNLKRCQVKIAKLDLDKYDTQIDTRKTSTVPQKLKKGLQIVLYPGGDDDRESNMDDKMLKDKNSAVKKFCCDICGKKFRSKGNIKEHIMAIHTGVKPCACKVCKQSFSRLDSLQRHLRIHTGEKPFVCGVCSKAFNQSSSLSAHKRIHSGEKPFVCGVCSKAFNQSSSLSVHKRIHSGEKPFVCGVCSKAFNQSSSLSVHKRIHSGEKPFVCDVCHKSFNNSSSLTAHKRIHSGEKPFVCDVCHKSFNVSSNLSAHKRIHPAVKSSS